MYYYLEECRGPNEYLGQALCPLSAQRLFTIPSVTRRGEANQSAANIRDLWRGGTVSRKQSVSLVIVRSLTSVRGFLLIASLVVICSIY